MAGGDLRQLGQEAPPLLDSRVGPGDAVLLGGTVRVLHCLLVEVDAEPDNRRELYGPLLRKSYKEMTRRFDRRMIGVSNVGRSMGRPWQGRKCIGCSLAIGPGGAILAEGPYGEQAEAIVSVDVRPRPPIGRGAGIAPALRARGYRGP